MASWESRIADKENGIGATESHSKLNVPSSSIRKPMSLVHSNAVTPLRLHIDGSAIKAPPSTFSKANFAIIKVRKCELSQS